MIEFNCPHCALQYSVEDSFEGRAMRCRSCEGFLTVPSPGEAAEPRELTSKEQVAFLRHLLQVAEKRYQRHEERFKRTQDLSQALYRKYKDLRVDFDERERFLHTRQARIEEAQAQLDRLTHEIATAAQGRGQAEARLAEVMQDLSRKNVEWEAARLAAKTLEENLREARVAADAGNTARKELDTARAELKAARDEITQLKERIAASTGEPRVALARLESVERESTRLGQDLERERAARTTAELECRAAAADAAQTRERLAYLEEEIRRRDEEPVADPAEMEALRVKLDELQRNEESLREKLSAALTASGESSGRLDRVMRENERLSAEVAAVRTAEAEVVDRLHVAEQRAALADTLKGDRDEARRALREAEAIVERLRSEAAQKAEGEGQSRTAAAKEIKRLQSELAQERETRQEREAAARAAGSRAERVEADAAKLREQVDALLAETERIGRLESSLDAEHTRVAELEASVQRLMSDLRESTRAHGVVETRLDEREQAIQVLQADLAEERAIRYATETRATQLAEELASLRERTQALRERLEEAERLIEQADERTAAAHQRAEIAEDRAAEAHRARLRSENGKSGDGSRSRADDGIVFIPEVVGPSVDGNDAMIETLLRFIGHEG